MEIKARNVEEAWNVFKVWMADDEWRGTHVRTVAPRGMRTLEITEPVVTTYTHPEECVLMDPVRDANPFFHLYEALWILSGHKDVARLAHYVPSMAQFSDDGTNFGGAYGYRLRNPVFDQLQETIKLLRRDPDSRRAVLSIGWMTDWNGVSKTKDQPCNTTAYVKLRDGRLYLTVCNRSNDAVWGCYGTNAVQFSYLLQYLAAHLECKVGSYVQFSDSLHVYLDGESGKTWQRCANSKPSMIHQTYTYRSRVLYALPLVDDPVRFDEELKIFTSREDGMPADYSYGEPFLKWVALPMCVAYDLHKENRTDEACTLLLRFLNDTSKNANDEAWKIAGYNWMKRRLKGAAA